MKNIIVMMMVVVVLFTGTSLQANSILIEAGIEDDFALPTEPATPSNHLDGLLISTGGRLRDFDAMGSDAYVAHTFDSLPQNILGATLSLTIKASSGLPSSDAIIISFAESNTVNILDCVAWERKLGVYSGGGTLFPDPDTGLIKTSEWVFGDQATLMVDLAALPLRSGETINIISNINSYGFVDVIVSDDSAVDYMYLNLTVPEPATLLLFGLGGLVVRRRK